MPDANTPKKQKLPKIKCARCGKKFTPAGKWLTRCGQCHANESRGSDRLLIEEADRGQRIDDRIGES